MKVIVDEEGERAPAISLGEMEHGRLYRIVDTPPDIRFALGHLVFPGWGSHLFLVREDQDGIQLFEPTKQEMAVYKVSPEPVRAKVVLEFE